MRRLLLALAALLALSAGLAVDFRYGDARFEIANKTLRHWSLVDAVSVFKPACADFLDTGGWPCGASNSGGGGGGGGTLAIDSQEASGIGHHSASSPLSWSFTNTAGNLLVVGVDCTGSTGPPSISSVTYNGIAMSLVPSGSMTYNTPTNPTTLSLYYLKSPAAGSNSVAVTFSGGTNPDCIAGAISFDNATASPVGTAASNNGGPSGTASVSLSGTTSGDFIVSLAANGTAVNGANSPNTISWLLNVSGNTSGDNAALGQFMSGGGVVTPSFSVNSSDVWGIIAVEIF